MRSKTRRFDYLVRRYVIFEGRSSLWSSIIYLAIVEQDEIVSIIKMYLLLSMPTFDYRTYGKTNQR